MKLPKLFVQTFLIIQFFFLSGIIKNVNNFDSYFLEALEHIFFTATALKHQYNFFTMPADMHYRYYSSNMHLIGLKNGELDVTAISKNGSIKNLVSPVNQCRISNVVPVSFQDTLYFEALARSHALFFLNANSSASIFRMEILENECILKRESLRYSITKRIDTVYKRDFYLD